MNNTASVVALRQAIARALYLAPFWLAFLYVPAPANILATCLLAIKTKLPSDTDLYELQVLAKQAVMILVRDGTDEDQKGLERMKKAFVFGDEVLHEADIDGASAKLVVDALFLMVEGLSIAAMVAWFILFQVGA